MKSFLCSVKAIIERLGIPITVTDEVIEVDEVQLTSIEIYNVKREIFGSFYYWTDEKKARASHIICGPILMAEVKFGLEEAQNVIQEFGQILTDLYTLSNHCPPKFINYQKLGIEEFYTLDKFSYNTFGDMNEFYKLELLFFSHVKDRNKIAVLRTFNLLINYYYKNLSSEQLKCFYCALITLLTRVEIEKGVPVGKVFDQQLHYYQYLKEIQNIRTFEELGKRAIHDFFAHPANLPKKSYNPIIVYILNYVENHITEVLTLNEICTSINRDSKYVGKLFYKEIGMHFKEFTHFKKIEKAKQYLLFSNKTLNQISEELSFSSQSHFSSIFKKIVGMSPCKYQRNRVYYSY